MVSTVDELISPIDGRWDIQLIRSLFWPVDVHRILQILIRNGHDDVVACHHNRNELFSVKSAYHCQWNQKYGDRNNVVCCGWHKLKLSMERAMETVNTEQDQNFPLVSASWMHSMFGDPGEQAYIQHWKLSNVSDGCRGYKTCFVLM